MSNDPDLIERTCPDCEGWGEIMADCECPEGEYHPDDAHYWAVCATCGGAGEVIGGP